MKSRGPSEDDCPPRWKRKDITVGTHAATYHTTQHSRGSRGPELRESNLGAPFSAGRHWSGCGRSGNPLRVRPSALDAGMGLRREECWMGSCIDVAM